MKYILIAATVFTLILIACTSGPRSGKLFSTPDEVKADEYSVNIDRDTILVTKNGAMLKIPKDALSSDNGNTVTLEIKEAYSIKQMIEMGLTTRTSNGVLSSGGMIYINAKAGQNVTIKQAIQVTTPANYLQDGMQLYKGVKGADGSIEWNDPKPLDENKQQAAADAGKVLFQTKCGSCHGIGKAGTGPDLAHFVKRFPEIGWYYEHSIYSVRDEVDFEDIRDHDPLFATYKCNLVNKYGSAPSYALIRNDRADSTREDSGNEYLGLFRYIQNESDRRNLPLPEQASLFDCADSCIKYKEKINQLTDAKSMKQQKKDSLLADKDDMVDERRYKDPVNIPAGPPTPVTPSEYNDRVSPENYRSSYYQFSIETFGWYNIDILMKNVEGNVESELFVRIVGQYRERVQVYLVIPSKQVYVPGGPAERNKEEYAFVYKNGKIYLPQNEKAFIMAFTEVDESIAFSIHEFNTKTQQEIELTLNLSTKEAFNEVLNRVTPSGMNVKVKDSKNAAAIRLSNEELKAIDEALKKAESLKPKGCDCDCQQARPAVINMIDEPESVEISLAR